MNRYAIFSRNQNVESSNLYVYTFLGLSENVEPDSVVLTSTTNTPSAAAPDRWEGNTIIGLEGNVYTFSPLGIRNTEKREEQCINHPQDTVFQYCIQIDLNQFRNQTT